MSILVHMSHVIFICTLLRYFSQSFCRSSVLLGFDAAMDLQVLRDIKALMKAGMDSFDDMVIADHPKRRRKAGAGTACLFF